MIKKCIWVIFCEKNAQKPPKVLNTPLTFPHFTTFQPQKSKDFIGNLIGEQRTLMKFNDKDSWFFFGNVKHIFLAFTLLTCFKKNKILPPSR